LTEYVAWRFFFATGERWMTRTRKITPPTAPPTMAALGALEFVCILGTGALVDWRVDEEVLEDPLLDEEELKMLGFKAKVPKEGRYVK
jgi:hypothetical protein